VYDKSIDKKEVAALFFSENELSLELLGVFKIRRGAAALESNNDRAYDSISLRAEGTGTFKSDGQTLSVGPGELLYLPRHAHYLQKTEGELVYAIHFLDYSYNAKRRVEIIQPENAQEIEALVRDMYREWSHQQQGYRYKCTAMLYSLLYLLNRQSHQDQSGISMQGEKLKKAIQYIHAHYRSETIGIPQLAEMCALSETYFRKLFKQVCTTSPNRYIMDLRLEYASQLLCSGLYNVGEVSDRSGFGDAKYMSKLFKKHFGVSPRDYAKHQPSLK
jgi:AraC-like DNA-binding protein